MSARLKPKHQRLVLVVIALVVIIGAGILAAWALRNQASYFYVPTITTSAMTTSTRRWCLGLSRALISRAPPRGASRRASSSASSR